MEGKEKHTSAPVFGKAYGMLMEKMIVISEYNALHDLCWHMHIESISREIAAAVYASNAPFASMHVPLASGEKELLRGLIMEFPEHDFSGWEMLCVANAWKFERHNQIANIFGRMTHLDVLNDHGVCFGGGTAIAMCHDEVRQSDGICFMVPDKEFPEFSRIMRKLPCFPYDDLPYIYQKSYALRFKYEGIKIEFVRTADFPMTSISSGFGFDVLDAKALMLAKLLANDNRYADRSCFSRDMVDIAILLRKYPETNDLILNSDLSKKYNLDQSFLKGLDVLAKNWIQSFAALSVDKEEARSLMRVLGKSRKAVVYNNG